MDVSNEDLRSDHWPASVHSTNAISFTLALTITALVISKLISAYLFCGFNGNYFVDVSIGVALSISFWIISLLGLAFCSEPKTAFGRCCLLCCLAFVVLSLLATFFAAAEIFLLCVVHLFNSSQIRPDDDPFNVCGNRTSAAVLAEFSNAVPTFKVLQRIDVIFKLSVAIGWIVPSGFSVAAYVCFLMYSDGADAEQQPLAPVGRVSDQPVIVGESAFSAEIGQVEERPSEVNCIAVKMENHHNENNDFGSNAESQFKEVKESEFGSISKEQDEDPTATTTVKEDN